MAGRQFHPRLRKLGTAHKGERSLENPYTSEKHEEGACAGKHNPNHVFQLTQWTLHESTYQWPVGRNHWKPHLSSQFHCGFKKGRLGSLEVTLDSARGSPNPTFGTQLHSRATYCTD